MSYFTIEELTRSNTAAKRHIDNTPPPYAVANMQALIDKVLDPLRVLYGKPIHVSSGYRCEMLNKAVGGVKTSLHRIGSAADIEGTPNTKEENKKLFDLIVSSGLPFYEVINERNYSWVHVGYRSDGINPKKVIR